MARTLAAAPRETYLSGMHVRLDWGYVNDPTHLQQRLRVPTYEVAGSHSQTTPEVVGGSSRPLTVGRMMKLNPLSRSIHHRAALLVTGWVCIATGVVSVLHAGFGAGPFDVLNVGIARHLGVQVGTASWVTTALLVSVAMLLGKRPGPATFLSAFFVGGLVNVLLGVVPTPDVVAARGALLCGGVACLYFGVSLVVIAGLGYGAVDMLMFALGSKGISLRIARLGIEASAVCAGVLLGGTAGVATILIALGAGPVLVRLIPRVDTLPLVAGRAATRVAPALA